VEFSIGLNREAEVDQADLISLIEHNVFGLDVPMNNVLLMAVVQSCQTLFDDHGCPLLGKSLSIIDVGSPSVEKTATLAFLHHKVEKALIVISFQVLDNVWVVNSLHDPDFEVERVDIVIVHVLLVQHLDCYFAGGVRSQRRFEDFPKIACPDLFSNRVSLAKTVGPSLNFDFTPSEGDSFLVQFLGWLCSFNRLFATHGLNFNFILNTVLIRSYSYLSTPRRTEP